MHFQVIEIIGKENVKLNSKQIDELIELIDKEEILEVEDKIEKALQKDKEAKEAERLLAVAEADKKKSEIPSEDKNINKVSNFFYLFYNLYYMLFYLKYLQIFRHQTK